MSAVKESRVKVRRSAASTLDQPLIRDGRLRGSIYCRVVEARHADEILKTGMLSQMESGEGAQHMWHTLYGGAPIWLSRKPWWGYSMAPDNRETMFLCDLAGLAIAPDFAGIDDDWPWDFAETGKIELRTYEIDGPDEGRLEATYDAEALRDRDTMRYLIGLNNELSLTCLEPIGPERIRVATPEEIEQLSRY